MGRGGGMTRGTRLCVWHAVECPDGGYRPAPVRDGEVLGHPIGDPSRVWVRWAGGDKAGQLELMRTEDAERWVWRAAVRYHDNER